MPAIPDEVRDFLSAPRVARIATCGGGLPYATPVWYEWASDLLLVVLAEARPHLRNLRANPEIAVCIDDDPRPQLGAEASARGVLVRGRAELTAPTSLAEQEQVVTPAFLRIAARYLGPAYGTIERQPAEILSERRALVTVVPRVVTSWGF